MCQKRLVSYLYWTKDLVLYRCSYSTFIIAHKNVYHNQAPHCIASDVFRARGARQLRVVWFALSGVVGGRLQFAWLTSTRRSDLH